MFIVPDTDRHCHCSIGCSDVILKSCFLFPDNIGDHTPKIGDGVITVTLILITRVQCMLSPNIFSNLETFQESTPTPPSEP